MGQLFTAGMIAGGLMSTSFQYLAITIATERENGMLKRLFGTPMPRAAYFAGKVVQVTVCAVAETALLIAVGMLFYHLHLPTAPGRWWTFAWVFVLGSAACALLGIAASSVPRSSASAMPVITLPFTVLKFISGVYVPFTVVPAWMRVVASFFPLKWMAQGMRSVFLPEQAAALEPAGQLGARAHRPGPGGLDSGRIGAVREDVPLAIPRLMPDQPRPSARIVAEPRWDVYYAVVLAASLAIVEAAPAATRPERIIATAALAAMVPWYLFLGRPLMMQDQPATGGQPSTWPGSSSCSPPRRARSRTPGVLAFGLLPMCFHVTTARRAMVVRGDHQRDRRGAGCLARSRAGPAR